jgi:hypothetical protein
LVLNEIMSNYHVMKIYTTKNYAKKYITAISGYHRGGRPLHFCDVTLRRLIVTNVSAQPIGPIVKAQAVQSTNLRRAHIPEEQISQADNHMHNY